LNDVGSKNGLSFAEKCLTQTFAVGQIRSGKSLEGFSMPMAIRSDFPTSGMAETFDKKLK
jgi:hypothetical protein